MPCSTTSFLAISRRSSAYFTVQTTCPILKSPNPSTASLVRCSLCKLNKNWSQTATLSNFSSNLHTSSATLVQSYFNTLLLIQFADHLSHQSIHVLSGLHLFGPVWVVKCPLPVHEASTHFCIYVQNSSWYYSQNPNCISCSFPLLNMYYVQNNYWSATTVMGMMKDYVRLT
jgi:hypothetical protein